MNTKPVKAWVLSTIVIFLVAISICAPILMNQIFGLLLAPDLVLRLTIGSAVGSLAAVSVLLFFRSILRGGWRGYAGITGLGLALYFILSLVISATLGEFDSSVFVFSVFPPFGFVWLSWLCLLLVSVFARRTTNVPRTQTG